MKKALIIQAIISLIGFNAFGQEYYKNLETIDDSVYIFFDTHNPKYSFYELGAINGNISFRYTIFMEYGLDLCFSSDYYPINIYKKKYSFTELIEKDIKDYWWLHSNYQDTDYVRLCEEKLKSATTDFFLVIPDSVEQTAAVLHLFNCNYSEE